MDLFGVMVDIRQNRIVYPVCDINGNLINIKGRTRYLDWKKLKIPKYINYFKVGVMDYFQGLNITLPYVEQKKEIIIFESIKSVMKAYGWGYKNCASAEKHTLTDEQVSLLVSLGVDIVLAYDSDVSYQNGDVRKSIDKLRRITNTYIIDDKRLLGGADAKNAPVDLGKEIWEQLYQSRKKVV
jgi:DNA primase